MITDERLLSKPIRGLNSQHAVKNLAKYYLFEKGTELTADTIPQGLKPLDENSDLFRQVFTFGLKDDPDLLDEQYTFQYASGS